MAGGVEQGRDPGRVAAWERRLFELSLDLMFVVDREGRIQHLNPAAQEITGWAGDEVIGRPYVDFIEPQDVEVAGDEFGRLVATGDPTGGFPVRIVRRDGQAHWIELRAALDPDTHHVYIVARDITARSQGVADAMTAAFLNAPIGWAMLNAEGRFREVNGALCEMLRADPSELIGREVWSLEASTPEEVVAAERRNLREGLLPSFRMDRTYRRLDETTVDVSLVGTLVADPRGAPLYYVCQVEDITRRRAAQTRLAANEAKLAEAQQIARLGSWEWDVSEDRVTWSDELYRIYGLRPDRYPGAYGSELEKVHPDDRERVQRVIEAAIAERRAWSLDYRIMREDGEERMLHARGDVVVDEEGELLAVRGTCQDVTESRRVEDALRAAEQLFRQAFDEAPIGMALLDAERHWLRTNRALAQMLGRNDAELRTGSLDELTVAEDRDGDRALFADLIGGTRRSFAVEKRLRHADGRDVPALVHVSALRGEVDRAPLFLCQLVDLSERRRAEAERRRSEQLLRAIVDNSPAVVVVKDAELRYALVNRRWEQLHGLSAAQVVGRTDADLFTDRAERETRLDHEVLRTGRPFEVLAPVEVAGRRIELLTVKFPLLDADGRATAVCAIGTDVTERRRSAAERADLARRLARAERLEAVGQLAGGVAHDFNNLLSVILTCAGFAQNEAPAGTALREDIDEIKHAAERAGELVRRLLAFGRKEVVQPRVIDLGVHVGELEGLLRRSMGERSRLEVVRRDEVPSVLIDAVRVEQVLLNLVLNARDALAESGGVVTVTVEPGPSGWARLTVADDGPGMPPAVAERAFEPFFTTKGSGEGTGLGLATVDSIVADAGGVVSMRSSPGRGTTVSVDLPPAPVDAPASADDAPPELPDRGQAGVVLVVEDQQPVRRQARRVLEAHGFRVVEAGDGDEALTLLDGVDLLLTDVVMPGMSGRELARVAVERRPGLRVVYMSGHTVDALVHEGVREGDVGYVRKPFTEAALLHAVVVALAPEPIG